MFATQLNDEKVTELLLRNGADPHVQDYMGRTVFHYAIKFNCAKVIFKFIIDYNDQLDRYHDHFFEEKVSDDILNYSYTSL